VPEFTSTSIVYSEPLFELKGVVKVILLLVQVAASLSRDDEVATQFSAKMISEGNSIVIFVVLRTVCLGVKERVKITPSS